MMYSVNERENARTYLSPVGIDIRSMYFVRNARTIRSGVYVRGNMIEHIAIHHSEQRYTEVCIRVNGRLEWHPIDYQQWGMA